MNRRPDQGLGATIIAAVLLAALGAGLTLAAAPRVVGSLVALPGDGILARIRDRKPVTVDDLRRLTSSREAALAWHETGRRHADLALARLMLLERRRIVRTDRDLPEIRASLRRGLMLTPADAYGWTRLAGVERLLATGAQAGLREVEMAILTGPYERPLAFPRLAIALSLRSVARPDTRILIDRQIRWAWRADRWATVAAARHTQAFDAVRAALYGAPRDLATFRAMTAE